MDMRPGTFKKGHQTRKGQKNPNAGRKPLATRELCAKAFTDRIPLLAEFADSATLDPRDRINAMKLLSSVGIPAQQENLHAFDAAGIALNILGIEAKD